MCVIAATRPSTFCPMTLMGNCEGYAIRDSWRGMSAAVMTSSPRLRQLIASQQLGVHRSRRARSHRFAVQRRDGQHFFGGGRQQQFIGFQNLLAADPSQLEWNAGVARNFFDQAIANTFEYEVVLGRSEQLSALDDPHVAGCGFT